MINYSIMIIGTKPGTKKENITQTKAYGTAQVHEMLSFGKFCQHVTEHNSPFSKGTIKGLLVDAVHCILEQPSSGGFIIRQELT
jgi:hypothetical protein